MVMDDELPANNDRHQDQQQDQIPEGDAVNSHQVPNEDINSDDDCDGDEGTVDLGDDWEDVEELPTLTRAHCSFLTACNV
jgi:hypothetical protein